MFCVGLILYEMLLPPMKTFFERKEVFEKARVMINSVSVNSREVF